MPVLVLARLALTEFPHCPGPPSEPAGDACPLLGLPQARFLPLLHLFLGLEPLLVQFGVLGDQFEPVGAVELLPAVGTGVAALGPLVEAGDAEAVAAGGLVEHLARPEGVELEGADGALGVDEFAKGDRLHRCLCDKEYYGVSPLPAFNTRLRHANRPLSRQP